LIEFSRTDAMRQKLEMLPSLLARDAPPTEAAQLLGQDVTAPGSVPFALYAFLRHPGSYEDCLFCAILNGGDRDTLGAMACALSGAFLGIEALPAAWRGKLENGQQIEALAAQLAERKRQQDT
jgi:poly(ADP-ribose) glycohydrolase ARH3